MSDIPDRLPPNTMCPGDVEVLFHCHCIPEPHPRRNSETVQRALQKFLAAGLIEPTPHRGEGTYTTTKGGVMLMEAMCRLPFPVMDWMMPS